MSVNTSLSNLADYLTALLKNTNMKCLTPDKALSGECGFMAANLYAKVKLAYFDKFPMPRELRAICYGRHVINISG